MTDSAAIKRKYDKDCPDCIFIGQELKTFSVSRVPSGILAFDIVTGGGIPEGRFSIFKGKEQSGKTTMALRYAGQYQRKYPDKKVVFVDFEHTYDSDWAENFLFDEDRIIVLRPTYGEIGVDMTSTFAEADDIGLIIIDSIAAIIPSIMSDASAGDDHVGLQPKLVNKMIRKLIPIIENSRKNGRNLTVLMTNQVRANIGAMKFGPQTIDPGGFYKDHMSSMTVRFYPARNVKLVDKTPVKGTYQFQLTKNKVGLPKMAGEFVMFQKNYNGKLAGEVEETKQIFEYGKRSGIIRKEGTKWIIGDNDEVYSSIAEILAELEDQEISNEIKDLILPIILNQSKGMTEASLDENEVDDADEL